MSIHSFRTSSPLHEQVRWKMLQRIRAGEFAPESAIPNEAQLCEEYGVSRITVRRAIADLCADEILYRRRGVGTFVVDPVKAAQSINLRGSLSDVLVEDPRIHFSIKGVSHAVPDDISSCLTSSGEKIVRLDFEVTLKGEPFALAQIYALETGVGENPTERFEGTAQPILKIANAMGSSLESAEQTIFAGATDGLTASILGLPVGTSILQMQRNYLDVEGRTISVVVGHFHPDRIEIKVKLHLSSGGTPHIKGHAL